MQPNLKRSTLWSRRLLLFVFLAYSYGVNAQINLSLPVGTIAGEADVSEIGSATYSIPVELPMGANQLTPALTLSYNSMGNDGLLGWGWSLQGVCSVITRNGPAVFQNGLATPVNYTNTNDVFSLDGNRLTLVSGTNGGDGAVYATESTDFSKVESFGGSAATGPVWFRVTAKDGKIYEYRATVLGQGAVSSSIYVAWYLSNVQDTYGNVISYAYGQRVNYFVPASISYSYNSGAGTFAKYTVQFLYDLRPDVNTTYNAGQPSFSSMRLLTINVTTGSTMVKQYQFGYTTVEGQSFLASVTEGGLGGIAASHLNPTTFQYGQPATVPAMNISSPYSFLTAEDCITGDFNGDGKTDILKADYKFDSHNIKYYTGYDVYTGFTGPGVNWIYGTTFPVTGQEVEVLAANKRYAVYDFLSNDFDGDGKDDVVMLNTTFDASANTRAFNKITVNYSRYYSAVTGPTFHGVDYASVPSVSGLGIFKYIYPNGNYYVPGDFDGDGKQDYILILGTNSSTNFKAFMNTPQNGPFEFEINNFGVGTNTFGSAYFATTVANANSIIPIDFDGDGRTELLVTKGNTSYVLSISPIAPSSGYVYSANVLYSTTAIQAGYRMYPGDFNGDGKTDLLVRASSNSSSVNWQIYYSNGKSFLTPTGNVPFAYTVILPKDGSFTTAHHLIVSDLNGDGKSDILHLLDLGSNSTRYAAYYSTGDNTFLTESNTGTANLNGESEFTGDFNSDGKSDCGTLTGITGQFVTIYPFKQNRQLSKVTDGLGSSTTFNYAVMTGFDGLNVYNRSTQYEFDNSSTLNSNQSGYTVPRIPLTLAYRINRDNGTGGTDVTEYTYTDGILHTGGRGFMGFKTIRAANFSNGYTTTTSREINTQYMLPYTLKQSTSSAGQIIAEDQFTTSFIPMGTGTFDIRNLMRTDKVINVDGVTGASTETDNTYDNYGNITTAVTKKGAYSGAAVTPIETITNTTSFGIHNTPVPALPDNETTTYQRSGQPAVSESKAYAYNNSGRLATMTNFSGQTKAITATLTYDIFGNVIQSVLTAAGVGSRTTNYTYDNSGLNVLKREFVEGGGNHFESFTYHPALNLMQTHISTDGLTTSYTYDNYGRVSTIAMPEGYTITKSLQFETSGGVYSESSTQPGGAPNVKTWYDALQREVQRQTSGFNNQDIFQSQSYDARGNLVSRTQPHYNSETAVNFTSAYDAFNRPTSDGNAARTVTTTYNLSGGLYKTTNTIGNKSTTKTMDASGQIVTATDNGGTLSYTYDSRNNLLQIQHNGVNVNSKTFDEYGKQKTVTDIDAGTISYETDAYGQVTKQTDAKGNIYTMTYDGLGRLTSRTGAEGTTGYTYWRDPSTGYANDNPLRVTGASGAVYNYLYDGLRHKQTITTTFDGNSFNQQYTYNSFGNPLTVTYPSGVVVSNTVDHNGTVTSIATGTAGNLSTVFTTAGMNGLSAITSYTMGNGKASVNSYNLTTGTPTRYFTPGIQDLNFNFDGTTGNLTSRNDAIAGKNEVFTYDYLDRLTNTAINNTAVATINYDGNSGSTMGNISSKNDAGNYTYSNSRIHAVNYILNPAGNTTPPAVLSTNQQDLTYTPFEKVASVNQNNFNYSFTYDPSNDRIMSIAKQNNTEVERKYYLGNYEKQIKAGVTREIHYVNNSEGICAMIVKENGVIKPYFVYRDHLGSILTVTDNTGTIVSNQNFDAWGRSRNPNDWSYNSVPAVPDWLYRGYSSHENLPQAGLINMNGRLYDPVTGRMLSPDDYTQAPYSTQSYNKYTYAANNPLKYNDPSGNFFALTALTFLVDLIHTATIAGHFWDKKEVSDAWHNFDPTNPDSKTNKAFRIDVGQFKTDPNRTFGGRVWQLVSRANFEIGQEEIGNAYSHYRNLLGQVNYVDYYGGATFVSYNHGNDPSDGWGATIGSYINGENVTTDLFVNDRSRHEYGHTLQSEILGPLYISVVGLPSLLGSGKNDHKHEWMEVWADQLSYNYLNTHDNKFFDVQNYPRATRWNNTEYPRDHVNKDNFYYLFPPFLPGFTPFYGF